MEVIQFTPPYNATGQPAISLPLHWTPDGLPVGVQLVADYAREDLLLRVAAQCKKPMLLKRGMAATVDEWLGAAARDRSRAGRGTES